MNDDRSLLKDIEAALKTVDEHVFYGKARKADVYNYIVFHRSTNSYSKSKTSKTERFRVAIVREGSIPEGFDDDVISVVESVPGLSLSDTDPVFDYTYSPNTGNVVEILAIEFYRAKKR